MTFDPVSIEALQDHGYTVREARFLLLVCTHSGYFLAKHYLRFAGVAKGRSLTRFTSKLLDGGHARAELHANTGLHRYHVYALALYRAIGREESPNRRRRSVPRINVRLYALRFVLDHLDGQFFDGKQHCLVDFLDSLGVHRNALPASHPGPSRARCSEGSASYFPEPFPVFLTPHGAIAFTFIDERETSVRAFRGYLASYACLFQSLPIPSKVIFVSPVRSRLHEAQRSFHTVVRDPALTDAMVDLPAPTLEMYWLTGGP